MALALCIVLLLITVWVMLQDRCRLQRSITYWFEAAHGITNGKLPKAVSVEVQWSVMDIWVQLCTGLVWT